MFAYTTVAGSPSKERVKLLGSIAVAPPEPSTADRQRARGMREETGGKGPPWPWPENGHHRVHIDSGCHRRRPPQNGQGSA
jgi:hypothetical protein